MPRPKMASEQQGETKCPFYDGFYDIECESSNEPHYGCYRWNGKTPCSLCREIRANKLKKANCANCGAMDTWQAVCHDCEKPICGECMVLTRKASTKTQHSPLRVSTYQLMRCIACALRRGSCQRCTQCQKLTTIDKCEYCDGPGCQRPISINCTICKRELRTDIRCCRHWRQEIQPCPNCPQSGFICAKHCKKCVSCDVRLAGCIKCCARKGLIQCFSCRRGTKEIFVQSGLPKDLQGELYRYLFHSPETKPKAKDLRHPTQVLVNCTGNMISTTEITTKASLSLWNPDDPKDVSLRPVSDFCRIGPFIRGLFNPSVDGESLFQRLTPFHIGKQAVVVLKCEWELLREGLVRRPLIYEQDISEGIAYWTFDRREFDVPIE